MQWISFQEKEPDFQSDILTYDGTDIVSHDPVYISLDYYENWDPKPLYWIYVDDIVKEIKKPESS